MNKCSKICDSCGKESPTGTWTTLPKGWKSIEVKLGQYTNKHFDLCPDCLTKFGFDLDKYAEIKSTDEESIEKKLFNMFYEIAQMAAQDHGGN